MLHTAAVLRTYLSGNSTQLTYIYHVPMMPYRVLCLLLHIARATYLVPCVYNRKQTVSFPHCYLVRTAHCGVSMSRLIGCGRGEARSWLLTKPSSNLGYGLKDAGTTFTYGKLVATATTYGTACIGPTPLQSSPTPQALASPRLSIHFQKSLSAPDSL